MSRVDISAERQQMSACKHIASIDLRASQNVTSAQVLANARRAAAACDLRDRERRDADRLPPMAGSAPAHAAFFTAAAWETAQRQGTSFRPSTDPLDGRPVCVLCGFAACGAHARDPYSGSVPAVTNDPQDPFGRKGMSAMFERMAKERTQSAQQQRQNDREQRPSASEQNRDTQVSNTGIRRECETIPRALCARKHNRQSEHANKLSDREQRQRKRSRKQASLQIVADVELTAESRHAISSERQVIDLTLVPSDDDSWCPEYLSDR